MPLPLPPPHDLLITLVWRNNPHDLSSFLSSLTPDQRYTLVNRVDKLQDEEDDDASGYGPSTDEPQDSGFTALHYAAMRGYTEVVLILLNHRAEVNAVTALRSTALHLAVQHSRVDTVRELLQHGAEAACFLPRQPDGRTPLCLGRLMCFGEASRINSLLRQACVAMGKQPGQLLPATPVYQSFKECVRGGREGGQSRRSRRRSRQASPVNHSPRLGKGKEQWIRDSKSL